MVKLLLEQGASPALANEANYIPLDLANLNEKAEVFCRVPGGQEPRRGVEWRSRVGRDRGRGRGGRRRGKEGGPERDLFFMMETRTGY